MKKYIRCLFAGLFLFPMTILAQNYTVNSNTDANAVNLLTGETATPGQITLRSAIQAATAQPGPHIITFSGAVASPINLTLGQITLGNAANGNNITITGPGMNLLTVNQITENRIFSTGTGAVTILLQDITLNYTGPAVTPYSGGGGAIIAGGAGAASTFINCRFTNFQRQIGNGGAISQSSSLTSHNLTITNCIFINNRCGGAGGAVSFNSQGGTATITGSTFDNNHTGPVGANTGGDGGAVSVTGGGSGGTYLIERNTFLNNQVENVTGHAGAVMNTNGTLTLRFNRFIGNTCANVAFPPLANIVGQAGGATTHVTIADNNWWGVNTGPGTNDATALAAGAVMTLTKWLQLKTTASPNPICNTTPTTLGNTSTVTTSFLSNSASEAIAVSNLPVLIGLPVTWTSTLGSLSGQQATIQAAGTATALFTSNGTAGTATVNAQVDNVPASEASPARANITVNATSIAPTGATGVTTVCNGGTTTLTVSGGLKGTGAVTQWFTGSCGGTLVFTGDAFLTPSLITGTTYFVRYNGTCNITTCATVTVTINDVTGGTVAADQTICSGGDPALFTESVASTGSGALTYQWQSSTTSCAAGFSNIGGATGTTYDAPSGLAITTFYRRVTTSTLNAVPCTANSNCITVTVNSVTGGTIAANQTFCSGGDPAAFTQTIASTGSGALTYQWQSSTTSCAAGFIDIGGATSLTYDPPSGATVTTYYRRVTTSILNTVLCTANSNCVTIFVNDVTGGTVGSDQTICSGGNPAAFTQSVASTGSGALTYQWQSSTTSCAAGFSNIGGATAATYDAPSGLAITTYYRRVTTSTLNAVPCTANSNCITVTTYTIVVTNPATTTGTSGVPFSQTFTQSGGVLPVSFTTASTLPTGLSLATTGVLSGTPTQTGTFPIIVMVTDANGCTGTGATYNLVISAPALNASLRDALLVDNNGNLIANPGDQLRYTTTIRNPTTTDATGVNLNLAAPTNTTENPNSRSTSALARDDAFTTPFQTLLNVGNLTTNDFGLNAGVPTVNVVSFGTTASLGTTTPAGSAGTTDAGGTLTVFANGTFSYQPPVGFSGNDQFMYIATTGVAGLPNNDAVVVITVQPGVPPVAVNDPNGGLPANSTPPSGAFPNPYHGEFNTMLTVPDGANDLLANDNLGNPVAAIVSYGASTGLEQTSIGSPTPTAMGGSVTVLANGSFSYTPLTGFTGLDNFKYRILNAAGSSIATVTIGVGFRPAAVIESYTVIGNVSIIPNAAQGVLANDGGTGIVVTAVNGSGANVGVMITTVNGSNLTVNANGSFTYNPGPGFDGPTETFTYTAGNGFGSTAATTVTLNISGMVWFINNGGAAGDGRLATAFNSIAAYNSAGGANPPAINDNIFIFENVAAYTGSLTLLNGQRLIGQDATASLGTITGLTPNATYSAQFPVMNTGAPATTLTTTVAATNAINLNSAAGTNLLRGFTLGNTTGSSISGSSFGTLTISDVSKNGTGQALALTSGAFAAGSTIDNITTTSSVNAISLTTVTGSLNITTGAISGATGTAFNVSGGTVNVTYSGGITQANNAAMVSIAGGHATGTITFNTGALSATNGTGFQFDNADGTYNFNGTTTLNGGDAGIDLSNGCGGTFSFPAGISITNPTNEVIRIASSTATFTYGGGFTKNNNNISGITISGNTGGTIAINGSGTKTLSTGTGNAVNLTTNTGATINFTNNNLLLTTTSGTGFNATGGATAINVTGTGNTITSITGTALNVANTTIGASNLNFQSISANGAPNGMILNNTGSSGGLVVTGTGSAGTGGTIQNSVTDGVVITSSLSPTLSFMNINDNAGVATDDGMVLTNITGTVTFTGLSISGSPHNGITFDNFNTNLTAFIMTNSTIACPAGFPCQPSGTTGNDGILLVMRGTSILTSGLISGCTFSGVRAVAVQIQANDAARIGSASGGLITAPVLSNSFTIQNNTFTGNGIGIDMGISQVSSMAFQILNNTIVGKLTAPGAIPNQSSSHAINAFTAAGADTGPASHFFVGKIDGNTIGTPGVKDSGSGIGSGIRVVVQGQNTQGSVTVSNNLIREVPNSNILTFYGQNGNATAGTNTARFKIINNTMPAPTGSNLALCGPPNSPCGENGIFVLADEGTPVCNIITGNNIFDLSAFGFDIYLAERIGPPAGAQLTVEGTGGSNSVYILANNTLAGPSKFIDENANTSQVALNSCGAFPARPALEDSDGTFELKKEKIPMATSIKKSQNVIPIKREGEKWVSTITKKTE